MTFETDVVTWADADGTVFLLRHNPALAVGGAMYYWRIEGIALKKYLLSSEDVPWAEWPRHVIDLIRLPLIVCAKDVQWCREDERQFNRNTHTAQDPEETLRSMANVFKYPLYFPQPSQALLDYLHHPSL